jgi:hypothetical protein
MQLALLQPAASVYAGIHHPPRPYVCSNPVTQFVAAANAAAAATKLPLLLGHP